MIKNAFTMIELIFVIVILGILAAVAIPKLAATRNDANNARDCSNTARCVMDLGAEYTATSTLTPLNVQACNTALASLENAITFTPSDGNGDGVDDAITVLGAPGMCNGLNTLSNFGSSSVSF